MTSAEHPVQISLPGQTHVAHGPHDQTGMYVMHHAFRRDLARFESAVRQTPLGEEEVWRALAARWGRFATVLHHHHEVEDAAIWPLVVRRVDEAGGAQAEAGRAVLAAMEAEHEEIDPALAACAAGFRAMVEHPCADHRNALDVHLTAARAGLLEHLRHEETEALPLIQRVLTDADHAATEKAAERGYPVREAPFLVPWALEGLPADAAARVLEMAGPAYRLLLRLWRPGFRRRERRAFRYA